MQLHISLTRLLAFTLVLLATSIRSASQSTIIAIGPETLRAGVERFGINLSGQTYYDSGQMLRNLVSRNPGFEGEQWQSILHCKEASQTSCTDENPYTVWPAGFLDGAHFEVLSGAAIGASGTVLSSSAATPSPLGVTLHFAAVVKTLTPGSFLLVKLEKPGHADAGWWTSTSGGATFSTEYKDLSPHTAGKQALRIEAEGSSQSASVNSYFDSLAGHSFVQLHGKYRLQFRVKPLSAHAQIAVSLVRLDPHLGRTVFLDKSLTLVSGWQDVALDFPTAETRAAQGTVGLTFSVQAASVLLDDVSLTPATASANNSTAFRDEVVEALRDLHPGVLRYMDNGTGFGSSLDNLLAPPFARQRGGSSTQNLLQEDIPIGLHEFLTLCEAVGASPWFTMPPGLSPLEAQQLVEYLSGPVSTPYGKLRAALGHPTPWTTVFATIHLELGNEQWNAGSFSGSTMANPVDYAHRAAAVFQASRSSAYFRKDKFDLVLGSWFAVPWWTQQEVAAIGSAADSIAVAPYLFSEFNAAPNEEQTFGPMFAQPEELDSRPTGLMAQQAAAVAAAARPLKLAVYEVNLGTASGSVSQSAVDVTVPSLGAGLAVADHMLLMLRDLGISTQSLFALPEFSNGFTTTNGAKETTPLWGAVVDMGGATNLRRPSFLALQLVNQAILPTMLSTHLSGANPTWNQPLSPNDKIALDGAHLIQTFAFADGKRRSLILLNLSRDRALPVSFTGPSAPSDKVQQSVLTSAHITDNNESHDNVRIANSRFNRFVGASPMSLPPFSMTVLRWDAKK